jgi:hypothetical protein
LTQHAMYRDDAVRAKLPMLRVRVEGSEVDVWPGLRLRCAKTQCNSPNAVPGRGLEPAPGRLVHGRTSEFGKGKCTPCGGILAGICTQPHPCCTRPLPRAKRPRFALGAFHFAITIVRGGDVSRGPSGVTCPLAPTMRRNQLQQPKRCAGAGTRTRAPSLSARTH